MKNGFKEVVDKILRNYGLKTTSDCIGAVWADGDWSWNVLNAMGYRVERGISNPPYDYVILSKGKSTIQNILKALTIVKTGCIIIFRGDSVPESSVRYLSQFLKTSLCYYEYGDGRFLGVIFKRKEI